MSTSKEENTTRKFNTESAYVSFQIQIHTHAHIRTAHTHVQTTVHSHAKRQKSDT